MKYPFSPARFRSTPGSHPHTVVISIFISIFIFISIDSIAQIGKVGINTTTPQAMLHVQDSSVLFRGPSTLPMVPGPPPVNGSGTRMMWYPDKAAFRVGRINSTQWHQDSIGIYSLASGFATMAKGEASVAMGYFAKATGSRSIALGNLANAIGEQSVAIGSQALASGVFSTAMGFDTEATGSAATAMGFLTAANGLAASAMGTETVANGYSSLVAGLYNEPLVFPQIFVAPTTPLFIVGNGNGDSERSNAIIIRKDGRVGIGTNNPSARLHVQDSSVLFTGPATLPGSPGAPPVSGAGTRMMWYPDKAAFRAGLVTSTFWDKDSIGAYSTAFGQNVLAKGNSSFVAGGGANEATGDFSFVGGGIFNTASDYDACVLGGQFNTASGSGSFVGGGNNNITSGGDSFAGGGSGNTISAGAGFIGGGSGNTISAGAGFIGGGLGNTISGVIAFVGGGESNLASGERAFVGAGRLNQAIGENAFVGGGSSNQSSGRNAFVGGGTLNNVSNDHSFIGGGINNEILSQGAFIGGGQGNVISGTAAFISSGAFNTASGTYSFASGTRVLARSYSEAVVGTYNSDYTPASTIAINASDRLFVIGNGTSTSNRSNAVTVLKNGRVGIGSEMPAARLHVQDSSVLFTGPATLPVTPGPPPVSGAGTRMMWYPDKGAFRAGRANGLEWDRDSIGNLSIAFGHIVKASGSLSFIGGGINNTASGSRSFVGGGQDLFARSRAEAVFGQFNTDYSPAGIGTWDVNDRLFVLGNGTSDGSRSNAVTVLKNGNFGIGVDIPARTLHVRMGDSSGGLLNSNAVAVLERNANAFLNIVTPNANSSGILFGNASSSAHGGILYNDPDVLSGLAFRTNGNVTRMVLTNAGLVGIGTTTPERTLHVSSGSSGATSNSAAVAVFERSGSAVINLLTPNANFSGILFGNVAHDGHGSIVYNNALVSNGLAFQTNGGITRMAVTSAGNVGINTTTPAARLDVHGTVKIGADGTALASVHKATVNVNLPSIGSLSSFTQTFTVTGATTGSSVIISPDAALADGLIIAYARVSAANTVEAKFMNGTGSAINPPAMDFFITVIK